MRDRLWPKIQVFCHNPVWNSGHLRVIWLIDTHMKQNEENDTKIALLRK